MIDGLKFTVTGTELKQLYDSAVKQLEHKLERQSKHLVSLEEEIVSLGSAYDNSGSTATAFSQIKVEVRTTKHDVAVMKWKRDHIDTVETYLLDTTYQNNEFLGAL